MPRSEIAATAMALTVGACLAFPPPARADQFSGQPLSQSLSQPSGQPVSDAVGAGPAEARKRQDQMDTVQALQEARETDRLMRWLNDSALWTGASERTRARSIRFR